jgi:hypothetical protein
MCAKTLIELLNNVQLINVKPRNPFWLSIQTYGDGT